MVVEFGFCRTLLGRPLSLHCGRPVADRLPAARPMRVVSAAAVSTVQDGHQQEHDAEGEPGHCSNPAPQLPVAGQGEPDPDEAEDDQRNALPSVRVPDHPPPWFARALSPGHARHGYAASRTIG